jgi:hypothetical protein
MLAFILPPRFWSGLCYDRETEISRLEATAARPTRSGRRQEACGMAKMSTAAGEVPLLDVVHVLRQVNVIE